MESIIAKELRLKYQPVAILFADEKPEGALQFKVGARGCVVPMVTAAARGKTAVFDRQTTGCLGGSVGLCFGNTYGAMPGGFNHFLSVGRGEGYPEGEAYKKTPELTQTFQDALPFTDIPHTYVVARPLAQVDPERETPEVVCFYANPDQLSALVVLANYGRPGLDNVMMPFGAGCHTLCLLPYNEGKQERPRAVVGLTDVTVRPMVAADLLSFSVPYRMFQEMEANVAGSFLEKHAWQKVRARLAEANADQEPEA